MGFKNCLLLTIYIFSVQICYSQPSPIYKNLPVGKYSVGFKLFTITDESRVAIPEFDYLGNKYKGDRSRKITVQLWYPAQANTGTRAVKYADYSCHHLLKATNEPITSEMLSQQMNQWRISIERQGKILDEKWNELLIMPMLAKEDAKPANGEFPLLIGLMRPFTLAITNEFLASHGYTVAMIRKEEPGDNYWAKNAINEIPDIQFVINYLAKERKFNRDNIGTFGFSGAGFVPVLFAMHDNRIKALADVESLMYFGRDNMFQGFSASDYYKPQNLKIPFLHIFSQRSAPMETHLDEFESKTKFSTRYRLLLNQPEFNHGDFTIQAYPTSFILKTRGANNENIRKSFELFNIYLLNFFNAALKSDPQAKSFLNQKPILPQIPSSLWNIQKYEAVKPAPSSAEFENIIKLKGIEEAIVIFKSTLKNDSSTNLAQGAVMNGIGYRFLSGKKYKEAISIFKLNVELHPEDVNLFDSLSEAYETVGDKENMKKASQRVLDLLAKKTTLTEADKSLKEAATRRMN
jgi:hypothetical protein